MNINQKKVSLLSPCYNVEKHISDFLESILAQNYDSLEVILVDDGSTDTTPQIIKSYQKAFEDRGITLKYIRKENGGQASAMAVGLPYVSGEYLIWPDSDDILLKNSIQTRVEYMDTHPECGIVRCNGYVFTEGELDKPTGKVSPKMHRTVDLEDFVRFIVPWCPGCYMVRMDAWLKTNPERKIFCSRCGQNIQMLLPIVSEYTCHYLDEYVYGYILHENSHSHQIRGYEYDSQHIDDMKECVFETLNILIGDYSRYLAIHDSFNRWIHFQTAWRYQRIDEMKKYETIMRNNNEFYFDYKLMNSIKPDSSASKILRYASIFRRYILRKGI